MVHNFGAKLISFKHNGLKLCRRHLFFNAVKIMLFISDKQYYVPVKLYRMAKNIHLFKIIGRLVPENVKLKWNFIEI